jgi:hypothetical protein
MIGKQSVQRRCDKCIRATIVNTNDRCQLFCTMRKETVSRFDQCNRFFYGKFDKRWIK